MTKSNSNYFRLICHKTCALEQHNLTMKFLLSLAILLLAPLVTLHAINAPSPRPNILLIITDDQGYGDLSIHGNPHLSTPNIDRLGQSGVRFDRFYVNSFCAPTRAALLTGRWPLRCGVHGVTHNREAMKPEEVTLAEALKGAGYRTACIGKWHNGEQFPYTPPGQGFEDFFGFHNGHWNNYFNATLLRGAKPEKTSGYITDVLTDEAIKFIDKNAAQPFFCYLAFNAPHSPYQVPDKYFDKFKAKGFDDTVSAYWGMCENLDVNIGRLLAHLDRTRIANNTIVLFLTDNGGTAGVKLFNAGMRGGKTSVHEGGTRVPLFIHWPNARWQPHLVQPIASHIDLYPTLLDLCGVTPPAGPKVDGRSLRPLLEGDAQGWPERVLFTHNPIDEANKFPGALRTQRYRLVREIKGPAGGSKAKANDAGATAWQLYDMLTDPGETNNIAKEQPERVAELSKLYDAWFADIARDGLRRFPIPVGYAEENPVTLNAPQAYFTAPMRFQAGPGYANDWLTTWTDSTSKLWFDAVIATPGSYVFEIAYACPTEDAGSKIRLSTGGAELEATVPAAPIRSIPLPHRDEVGKDRYLDRDWATLKLGALVLSKGPIKLTLEALHKPGAQVMEFKHLRITKQ
jgi:arylsulfatase A